MLKKILCFTMSIMILVSLCGCNIFTADTAELLSPPALTGDMLPINNAIKESVSSDFTPQYPSRGNYRSAVILQDINKDGTLEAFAFYSTQDRETTIMNINAIALKDGVWKSVAKQSISAGGVDRVEFCDLDGDGSEEILVGWQIYGTSELKLAVYTLGDKALTQRMLEQYTHFAPCDLNDDDRNEIFIIRSFPTETRNSAHLYELTSVGVSQVTSCELDSTAKTLKHPVISTLSTGAPAVYIDEIKGVGAVTEVVFMEKGQLVNPLLNTDAKETTATLRSASLEMKDINNDGILEIPVQKDVPVVSREIQSEKQYLTEWCSFSGVNLTVKLKTLVNLTEGYYYSVPQKLLGKIAILRDSQNSLTELYLYDPEAQVSGERLMIFKSVPLSDWKNGKHNGQDLNEILNNGQTAFLCTLSAAAKNEGITLEKIKTDFKLFKE